MVGEDVWDLVGTQTCHRDTMWKCCTSKWALFAKFTESENPGKVTILSCALSVGAVEHRLRKYRDACNRCIPLRARDIRENKTQHLKLPSVRKLHIFKWLLPHCKNWVADLKEHDFSIYFPKLKELEDRNLKRLKIKPTKQTFANKTTLPDKVVEVLCEVYRKVVYVTCVQPYMYQEETVDF